MIARCDRCDRKGHSTMGYRWYPKKAVFGRYRCPNCGGKLRAKKKGESESCLVDARLVPPPR